jgi:arylsulfatase A-like enzyme
MSASQASSRSGRMGRLLAVLGVTTVVLAGAALVAYQYRYDLLKQAYLIWPIDDRPRVGDDQGFNILMVVLDACRADKIGSYGFDRATTPVLDEIALDPDAATFLNYYVQETWTKPSTASLFTGLYAHEHGYVYGHLESNDPEMEDQFKIQTLSPNLSTIADILSKSGFYTFGVVSTAQLGKEYGFDQGFAEYLAPPTKGGEGDDLRVRTTTALIPAISGRFFGYVHLLGCHRPFPPEFRDAAYLSRYGFGYDEEARRREGIDFSTIGPLDTLIKDGGVELTDDDVKFFHLLYESRLRWADRELLAPIIQSLRDSGKYDDTMIIVTADHGEELYDHRGYGHGHALWNEVIHPPLVVKYPKGERPGAIGARVPDLVRSIDIAPSLLSLAGVAVPETVRGTAALAGEFSPYAFTEDAKCTLENADICHITAEWSLIQDGFKLIETNEKTLLFNLKDDPDERRSLTAQMPEQVEQMKNVVAKLKEQSTIAASTSGRDERMDDDAVKALRGLGYVQ